MQYGTQFQALHRLGTALNGLRQLRQHSMKLRARLNADSNALKTMNGKIRSAPQNREKSTAPLFRQTRSGIQRQKSCRLGMETHGFRQISAHSILRQVHLNATLYARSTILGTTRSVLPTSSLQHVPDFLQMRSGTAFPR